MNIVSCNIAADYMTKKLSNMHNNHCDEATSLERDYYGCYCLKFIVKSGTHITEEAVLSDFGQYGEVVDVRGPGLFSGLRGNHVYLRFIDKKEAENALAGLSTKYHQLTPASISDVLPDNYGLYTISFYNKTGIPSLEVRREFSKFGEVKNLTGSLDVKGGRVFVSYKEKKSAVSALQEFFFRKDKYPNMKFALPRCEKDYFGCYCLKFYNKSGDVTEDKVHKDFGQFGEVVDVRGPGLFNVTGDDVYVRYKEKSSAEQALVELVGRYDSLCLAPPSDIQADKFGYYTITFVNDKCLSKSDVWYIFSKFGTVACVNGTFDCKKGRVFVSYKEKQGALTALETMLLTKEYHLQVSKNSTVRKNDYNVTTNNKESMDNIEMLAAQQTETRKINYNVRETDYDKKYLPSPKERERNKNGVVKFNRNVEKDIFGYFCLSFLNEDGDITEKKVRNDFGKFGEVVSVRGALGKQKGHVFVRFGRKEAAENCLNCLNSFPLSEMSQLFGKYLFLSPATPRDIDCDMYGLYSISFLNLNVKSFREIRDEFGKFGEIVRMTSGGGNNTDELVSISYAEKKCAVNALQTHFTNKEFPYLDIAKGSSLLLVNSGESSDAEEGGREEVREGIGRPPGDSPGDPFHDDSLARTDGGSDVVDELLRPLQSYLSIYRTGEYQAHNQRAHAEGGEARGLEPGRRHPHDPEEPRQNGRASDEEDRREGGEERQFPGPSAVLDELPIRSLKFSNPAGSEGHDEIGVRADFSKFGTVTGVSGKFSADREEEILVTFCDCEAASRCLADASMQANYSRLCRAPRIRVVPDKDGNFSLSFINNTAMGIRDITEEFSHFGEVTKVMQCAVPNQNGTKKYIVSYSDMDKALLALIHFHNTTSSFSNVDFAAECLLQL